METTSFTLIVSSAHTILKPTGLKIEIKKIATNCCKCDFGKCYRTTRLVLVGCEAN